MHTLIIAEAGVNHNGSYDLALKLIRAARDAGADIVKFQTFVSENLVLKSASKAEYQVSTTGSAESQLDMIKKLELPFDSFIKLSEACEREGIRFLSTPFDLDSIDFLDTLNMPFWKVPSGEVTNYPYLVSIAKTKRPVVMSTGMCELDEIARAVELLKRHGTSDISLLHCNTEYPTPFEDVNLRAMHDLSARFKLRVGYSDHTRGISVPIAAAALGAEIIEKHFTLSRDMEGPDHKASLEPDELAAMVRGIRNVELALGSGQKAVTQSERKNIPMARKSIVAGTAIRKGDLLSDENLTTKRPGSGLNPMLWPSVVGTRAVKDFAEDELICL